MINNVKKQGVFSLDDYYRQVVIAANWKMYKVRAEAEDFMARFIPLIRNKDAQIVIFPSAILLAEVAAAAVNNVKAGIQNIHWENQGAFTGEISAIQAMDSGCSYCLCGHSERRQYFDEGAEMITRKAQAALEYGLKPIVCIGETLQQRENDETFEVLRDQLFSSLAGINASEDILIAYEPVWAIGTGMVASAADAEQAIAYIRNQLGELWGPTANYISILYGGSVKPDNIKSLMDCPNIDGVLVGGASLIPESFAAIVNYNIRK
jgi:triosephosphate isomerase